MRLEPINISDISIGDIYVFLPTNEIHVFVNEEEIAWEVINPSNYHAYKYRKDVDYEYET